MFLSGGRGRSSQIDDEREQARANGGVLSGFRQKTGQRHEIFLLSVKSNCKTTKVGPHSYAQMTRT